jgi:hypothetical protein
MSSKGLLNLQSGNGELLDSNNQEGPNLHSLGLDESDDVDLLNEEYDDVTEIESLNVEDNLDDLQALIHDTQSK